MKKVFALLLAISLIMSLSLSISAAVVSPEGVSYYKVYVIDGQGAETQVNKVPAGDTITVTANNKGDFDLWMVYKLDGTPAKEGVDYIIVSGSMTGKTVTIRPLGNIIITGNYDGVKTKFNITNDEPHSPQTGDNTVYVLGAVMVLALAGAVVSKKQLAK